MPKTTKNHLSRPYTVAVLCTLTSMMTAVVMVSLSAPVPNGNGRLNLSFRGQVLPGSFMDIQADDTEPIILSTDDALKQVTMLNPGKTIMMACPSSPYAQHGEIKISRGFIQVYKSSNEELLRLDKGFQNVADVFNGKWWLSPVMRGVKNSDIPAMSIEPNHYYRVYNDFRSKLPAYVSCDGITEPTKPPLCGNGICDPGESVKCLFRTGFPDPSLGFRNDPGVGDDEPRNTNNAIGLLNDLDEICPDEISGSAQEDALRCPEDCDAFYISITNNTTNIFPSSSDSSTTTNITIITGGNNSSGGGSFSPQGGSFGGPGGGQFSNPGGGQFSDPGGATTIEGGSNGGPGGSFPDDPVGAVPVDPGNLNPILQGTTTLPGPGAGAATTGNNSQFNNAALAPSGNGVPFEFFDFGF